MPSTHLREQNLDMGPIYAGWHTPGKPGLRWPRLRLVTSPRRLYSVWLRDIGLCGACGEV